MKKIMLILAITGVLISCSSKDETLKKETVIKENAPQKEAITSVETIEVISVEIEKIVLIDKDYKSVSESSKKSMKNIVKQTKIVRKEKAVPLKTEMKRSMDTLIDTDVDKQIENIETETKVVKVETPVKESSSQKVIFIILGVILAVVGLFKRLSTKKN